MEGFGQETEVLRGLLGQAVRVSDTPYLLFSGGLDSSILAAILAEDRHQRVLGVTVTLESSGKDLSRSQSLAQRLGFEQVHVSVTEQEALNAIPELIGILGTFDPAIPNDLVVYFGLRAFKELGITGIMTGDGADELFAGYDFMKEMPNVNDYIRTISSRMVFNSNRIAKFFDMAVAQPFLDPQVVQFALSLPAVAKIAEKDGVAHGKWILRKAYDKILAEDMAWQDKRPLESGSGMDRLRSVLEKQVSDKELEQYGTRIAFINREHAYYYRIYREVVGDVPGPVDGQKMCPACGAGMERMAFHCRVCGGVQNWRPE